jgi:hypothetical protein
MRLFIIRHADPDYPNNTITAAEHGNRLRHDPPQP